jgi:tetratricopeptide (TPR) repeat protein
MAKAMPYKTHNITRNLQRGTQMAEKKTTGTKEILKTEGFVSFISKVQLFVEQNMNQLSAIGIIICIIVAGIIFWNVRQSGAQKESMALLNDAINKMSIASENRVDRDIKFNQVLEELKKITDSYPGTEAGAASLFYSGVCNYNLKKYDAAVSCYENFLSKTGRTLHFLKPFAYEGLGYVYEEKGDYKKALDYFEQQKNVEPADANPMAVLNLARCYDSLGDREKACKLYKDFMESDPPGALKEIAQLKTEDLCLKEQLKTKE